MITPRMAMAFWSTVEDCLVEFFSLSLEEAQKMTRSYRSHLASLYLEEPDPFPDMIYHSEPIYIAFDLMQKDVPFDAERYDLIQAKNITESRKRNLAIEKKVAVFRSEFAMARRVLGAQRRHVKSEILLPSTDHHKVLTSA